MNLRIFEDTVDEGDETIIIAGTADGFTVNPATITIVDNDFPSTSATLSVSPARLLESAEATEVTVTAKLDNGARSADVSVSLTLEGTATAADYTYTPATLPTLTIAAGSLSTSEKITVDPVGDDVDDNRDTVVVSGSVSSVSGFTVAGATIELLDFPPPAAVTDLRASVAGDGEARLEWTRPSGPVDGYRLERHYGHTLDEARLGEAVSPLLGPAATSPPRRWPDVQEIPVPDLRFQRQRREPGLQLGRSRCLGGASPVRWFARSGFRSWAWAAVRWWRGGSAWARA